MNVVMISGDWPPSISGVADAMKIYADYFFRNKAGNFIVITTEGNNLNPFLNREFKIFDCVKNWTFGDLRIILKILMQIKPDVVHIQYPLTVYKKKLFINFLPMMLKFYRFKTVITIHEYSYNLSIKGRMRLWPTILFSNFILVAEPVYIRHIKKIFPWKMVETINIASNVPPSLLTMREKADLRRKITGGENTILLGHFGFINRNKILSPLLAVLKRLNLNGRKAKLIFIGDIGTDSGHINNLHDEIKSLSIENDCIFTGHLEDYRAADYLSVLDFAVLLFQSGLSARNATFLAAMSQGIKIITTVNPLYKLENENIFFVENNKDIEEKLYQIINEKIGLQTKYIGAEFYNNGWIRYLEKHLEVYNRINKKI